MFETVQVVKGKQAASDFARDTSEYKTGEKIVDKKCDQFDKVLCTEKSDKKH